MDLKDKALQILEKTHLMSLATVDSQGVWVADVIYIHDDDLTIYWMSDPQARHSRAILENNSAAGTITFSTKSKELNLGIQFSGTASKIDEARYDLAIKHLTKRDHPVPSVEIDILDGDSWYMIKPQQIDLIDEESWGFEKKTLRLS